MATWDETVPTDGEAASQGAARIRALMAAIREPMTRQHSWDTGADSGNRGKHTPGGAGVVDVVAIGEDENDFPGSDDGCVGVVPTANESGYITGTAWVYDSVGGAVWKKLLISSMAYRDATPTTGEYDPNELVVDTDTLGLGADGISQNTGAAIEPVANPYGFPVATIYADSGSLPTPDTEVPIIAFVQGATPTDLQVWVYDPNTSTWKRPYGADGDCP